MNAVGIDISKGKSMVVIMRPFGEVVASPYEVTHTGSELSELARGHPHRQRTQRAGKHA